MIDFIRATLVASIIIGQTQVLAQSDNADAATAGDDGVCLVTTKTPGSFAEADVVGTSWLPRQMAEDQASADPSTKKVFDYAGDPLVTSGRYTSAEALCTTHFK